MFKRFGGLPGRFWRRSFLRHLRRHLRARLPADADDLVKAVGRDARAIYEASPKPDPGRKGHMIVNMCSLVLATYRGVQAKTGDGGLAFQIAQQTRRAIARALSCDSVAQVAGVGMPARASRKLVIDLSTQRSMAEAEFQTVTDRLPSAWRRPSRLVMASKEPAEKERTRTASGRPCPKPGIASPSGRPLSKATEDSGATVTAAPRRRSLATTPREPSPANTGIE